MSYFESLAILILLLGVLYFGLGLVWDTCWKLMIVLKYFAWIFAALFIKLSVIKVVMDLLALSSFTKMSSCFSISTKF